MKRNGPPKTPTNIKLLRGTFRKDRAVENEVQPELGIPECPAFLSDEAKTEWHRITPELAVLGLLALIDRGILAAYCEAWSDYVDACRRCTAEDGKDRKVIKTGEKIKYDKEGNVIERSGGNFIENPYYSIKKRSAELMHKIGTEFGFTPASRTRLSGRELEEENEFEKYLRKKQDRQSKA